MSSSSEKERFIGIIKDNKRILLKIIRSYCSNSEDWKDLEQEIIIQLWKSLKTYKADYKLSTWIYRVALNVAITHYRKDVKRKSNSPLNEAIFQLPEDDTDHELNDRTQLLYRFIDQLEEFDKAIIILHLEDNSYKEIAEILGISETNVGTKINRIKNKLKLCFSTTNDC